MLTHAQDRSLYGRMRVEAARLVRLRAWLRDAVGDDHPTARAVDAQIAATLRTCDALTGWFTFGDAKRHRAWKDQCRWGGGGS
jgi:hypothetical protein